MKLGKQELSLSMLIRRNWLDTEMRREINWSKVEQYASEMKDGADFPMPSVFIDPADELIRVGDGFHRILAHKRNKETEVVVNLQRGTRRDAFLHGIEINRQQRGLPFTFGDKEKCILTLMQDDETSKWTLTKMAETVGCSVGYVSQVNTKFGDAVKRPDKIIGRDGVIRSAPQSKDRAVVAERRAKALELFAEGMPKIQIARKLRVPRWSVQRYIYEATNEKQLVECPHCNGTGKIPSEKAAS